MRTLPGPGAEIFITLIEVETRSGRESEVERLTDQLQEIVTYIADHAGSGEFRAAFLGQPEVMEHLPELVP